MSITRKIAMLTKKHSNNLTINRRDFSMQNLEEQYENLYDFIKNLEILIEKNIFQGQHTEEVRNFGNEVMTICKSEAFNISINDLKSLNSFNELIIKTPNNSKAYLTSLIENFFTDIIEPTKDEL